VLRNLNSHRLLIGRTIAFGRSCRAPAAHRLLPLLLAGWLQLLHCTAATRAFAQSNPGDESPLRITSVQVGFGNHFKVGYWTPVWVTVRTAGQFPQRLFVDITTPDGDGTPARHRDESGSELVNSVRPVDGGQEVTVLRLAKPGRTSGEFSVEVRGARGDVLPSATFSANLRSLATPIASTRKFIVWLGGDLGVNQSLRHLSLAEQETFDAVDANGSPSLPETWVGYEAIDYFVLGTSQPEHLALLHPPTVAALDQWLRMGGKLLWSVGRNAVEYAGSSSRFASWSAGTITETIPLRRVAGIENFAGGTDRLEIGTVEATLPQLAVMESPQGIPLLYEGSGNPGERPLALWYAYGLGQITFVAFDLDDGALTRWRGRGRLMARLLRPTNERKVETTGWQKPIGYTDMAGQLQLALDQYRGITLIAFSWISAIIVAYLLLIGPADFFLLRRLRRPHWTWVTLAIFAAGTITLAVEINRRARPRQVRLNQVDLVDFDAASGSLRGTTWVNMFSPSSAGYDLKLVCDLPFAGQPPERDRNMLLSWQGLPGDALRGLDSQGQTTIFTDAYDLRVHLEDQASQTTAMPVPAASSAGLLARWWQNVEYEHEVQLVSDANWEKVTGVVRNPFSETLLDPVLYFAGNVYPIDRHLGPGESARIEGRFPKNLEWRLTQRRVSEESREVSSPWEPSSVDVPRIMDVMMLYGAAGGQNYTQLSLKYQPFVDLSEQLRLHRAILAGRLERRATTLHRDGEPLDKESDRQWTYGRVVLPVKLDKRSGP